MSSPRTSGVLELTGDAANGDAVYTSTCGTAACHGPDGDAEVAGAANLADEVPGEDDRGLVDIILLGDGPMPPQDHLTDQEVADVLAYLRATFG